VRLVGRARAALGIAATALACAGAGAHARPAAAASGWTTVTITASDSTPLACAYDVPSGAAPTGGWPGVILFHGLGQSYEDLEPIGSAMAKAGFAALACDARGTGASGGKWDLDGPSEVQDAQDLFDWFAARSDVSDTRIGAFGLSVGGGEVWNAAVAGVPFKALVPAITWTDLGAALDPDGVPKTGLVEILSQAVPIANWDPALVQAAQALLQDRVTPAVASMEAARSSRPDLHALKVPTLLLQGRHDFLFDLDQAIAAWKLLAGPKRLYLGDLGHPPAKNPKAEEPVYVTEAVLWLSHYLAGGPAIPGGVDLAHDPWDGKTTISRKLPAARSVSVNFPGQTKVTGAGFATRSARLTGGPHETFGAGFVTVHYSTAQSWTHLVATVSVKGSKTPVTEGAAPIRDSSGVVKIPLMDEAVLLPRGKKLVVKLGSLSVDDVYGGGTPIYAYPAAARASIKIGSVALRLSLLKHAVSK
jgi:alpha-beta hydrolase superfamily lysophospholipase